MKKKRGTSETIIKPDFTPIFDEELFHNYVDRKNISSIARDSMKLIWYENVMTMTG